MSHMPPPPARSNQVRMIHRPIRCFKYGLLGVIPLFGTAMALLALRLHRELAAETGVRWNFAPMGILWICGLGLITLFAAAQNPALAQTTALVFLGLQSLFVLRHYQTHKPKEWNPARHLAYWGAGLACAGLALSAGLVALAILDRIFK